MLGVFKVLNTRERRHFIEELNTQYNLNSLNIDYGFLQDRENRIFLISKDVDKIDLRNLRINSMGLYFGKIEKDGIRLSIEGTQLIGKNSSKNIIELNKEQVKEWFRGNSIDFQGNYYGYVILKHNDDYLGSGRFKENKILNYIPKERRIKVD